MNQINKKELKKAYKLTPPTPGIYAITNTVDNKKFIGAAMNVQGKLNGHKFSLLAGGHIFTEIQADYNKHGEENFTFEIIERLKQREDLQFDYSDELKERETYWLEYYKPYGEKGYNKPKKKKF